MKTGNRTVVLITDACLVLALAGSLLFFSGCAGARSAKVDAGAGEKAAAPAPEAPALQSPTERLSYALGMVLGNQFRDQAVEVDPDFYLRGFKDALAGGGTLLTEVEARSAVNQLQRELKSRPPAPPAVSSPAGIEVSFKLDTRLTQGMYMGDRWVSPPTFTSTLQEGNEITVEARAEGFGAGKRPIQIDPEWIPADPEMVSVSPAQGREVRITVRRVGQSTLKVVSPGYSKDLMIQATKQGGAIQVEISQ